MSKPLLLLDAKSNVEKRSVLKLEILPCRCTVKPKQLSTPTAVSS